MLWQIDLTFDRFIKMLYYNLKYNANNNNIKIEITIDNIKQLYEKQTILYASY